MIPKKIFFIWLGGNKPNYVDFAVNKFKLFNESFKIELIEYSINDIENIDKINKCEYDKYLKKCIEYILDKKCSVYSYHRNHFYLKYRKFIQALSNIFRLELLNNYGGIYLDCDTFPIKPLDDFLLNKKQFCAYSFPIFDQEHRYRDNFFIGKSNNTCRINDCYGIFDVITTGNYNDVSNPEWKYNRDLFFKCQLKSLKKSEYYIEHYCDRTWQNRTPLCKYDL